MGIITEMKHVPEYESVMGAGAKFLGQKHPKPVYREPSALIVICANAPMAYTTMNGVKVVPYGCLRD